jgi:hypothetical protein
VHLPADAYVVEVAMTSRIARIAGALLLLGLTGCEATKSSTPTAPTVAGPIPGVNITAPVLLEPAQGFKFKENEQPIRLVVQNATTSGVRPLSYTFEVAADSGFTTKVFSRSAVAPGDGKTSVQVDRLEIGRAYYWRSWAEDGANTGAIASAGFEIFPKPAVTPPAALAPVNNVEVASTTPSLQVQNATFVGPVGGLAYEFQVSTDQAFSHLVAAGIIGEGSGTTVFNSSPLVAGTTYFWRARASDGETQSDWSPTQAFHTAAAKPGPGPTPPGSPAPTGTCDALVNDKEALVKCIHATILPTNLAQAFEVTKRVAWALRGEAAGLLIKDGGENIISWQGYSFSAGRICYPDGHIFKVLSDVGGTNGPSWQDNGFVDKSLYVPAIDPSKQ